MTNYRELAQTWQTLRGLAPELFMPITDDASLAEATAALRVLDREMSDSPVRPHPLAELADTVMHRIMAYEQSHVVFDASHDPALLVPIWAYLQPALTPIKSDEQHAEALALLQPIWDAVADSETHPLGSLMALMIERIQTYEDERWPVDEQRVITDLSQIPDFASEEEEAAFWDTHSLAEGLMSRANAARLAHLLPPVRPRKS